MQDFQFVSFFLGHDAGDRARRLLAECELLDVALSSRANRHAWNGDVHFGVSLRLPVEDKRLTALLERLRAAGQEPFTRLDREHSPQELDSADWLIMRVASVGLYGGVDYGQSYRFENACGTCGAGAEPVPPLVAELGKMGKKDIDHLVYEGHFIVTKRIAAALGKTTPVRTLIDVIAEGAIAPELLVQSVDQALRRGLIMRRQLETAPVSTRARQRLDRILKQVPDGSSTPVRHRRRVSNRTRGAAQRTRTS